MENWKYIDNQFLIATRNNFLKALKISNYHDAALLMAQANEPLFIPIYTRYHPLHMQFVQKYNDWKSGGGSQEGETLNQHPATKAFSLAGANPLTRVVLPAG